MNGIQHAPVLPQEQGLTHTVSVGRRQMVRLLSGVALLGSVPWAWPVPVLAQGVNQEWWERHAWLTPWIEQNGLDPVWLERLLGPVELDKKVLYLMDHQTEAKPYHAYRALVLNWRKIDVGRRLRQRHGTLLTEVEAFYRVPPEIIVALWGLESDFGNNMGRFSVLRTLYTLAAGYPRRADYFRSELREFLLLCREEGWDPRLMKGSYAGAMGQVQMMPGSMRRYAVDFNQDGRRDVLGDVVDVLASIAAFLHGHGWCAEGRLVQPLEARVGLEGLVSASAQDRRPWREWRERGIVWPLESAPPDPDERLALIALEEADGPRYYMTFMNFWVITRWNRSNRFAMVVCEFARDLKQMERACECAGWHS
ncbi:MAG: lytic murein transglycosylase [Magnetococcales bacterium]|nr:lytic murein transglycosylase [Magnetococcales bacterium]